MDVVINHLLGVQILHHHFIDTDIPAKAAQQARMLGWAA
jgi:asparagine synthase (glutamine-hydrolysing)